MAVYPNMLTTRAGYDLISRANTTKKALIITRAALGKGDLGSNNIVSLTDLIDPVMNNLPLTNSIDHQNGHYEVEASIDNSELDAGFWAKEMGMFAKVDGDATDTLYAYTNGGIYVPYVNDKSKPDIQLVQCDFIVGNATNVEATIDVKVYITEGRLQKHNTDPAAHTPILNAIKAITGMSAYDVAPSKTIATMIPLLGFGGIVAQKLETNGYVKFANGFIIQWGIVLDVPSPYTCTFPTAFSVSPFAVIAMDNNIQSNPLIFGTDDYSTTGFKIAGRRVSVNSNLWFRYIAIGL